MMYVVYPILLVSFCFHSKGRNNSSFTQVGSSITNHQDERLSRSQFFHAAFFDSCTMVPLIPVSQSDSVGENDGVMLEEEEENDGIILARRSSSGSSSRDADATTTTTPVLWSPSGGRGSGWSCRDFFFFVGPGWFVSIAYIDPGNYQADIQAGSTSRYSLLFVLWWTSLLSMYVQMLCVRLAYHTNMTLAECQAKHLPQLRYLHWALAEFSTVITDLPEVIGIGIAGRIFFGWPYYVGVVLSLLTTMAFLATMNFGVRVLETIVFSFVGIMSIALFVEMDFVKPNTTELLKGWIFGFRDVGYADIFAITGVVGAVVMPHNLYLHTAACQARPVEPRYVKQAVRYSSLEPIVPIAVSFGVNLAIVAIAAEQVYGAAGAADVGLSNFCDYFAKLKAVVSCGGLPSSPPANRRPLLPPTPVST
jgi:Natural resistance-associated macrophage protein